MTIGRLPDFLILGAMRSGTTSLYRWLDAHPQIFMVPKELQFFTDHHDEGLDWYRTQFAAAGSATILGEATADYFAREIAMERIRESLPEARFVVVLREPVVRAWSHFCLLAERGIEHRSFPEALDFEEAEVEKHEDRTRGVFYLLNSLYDAHLERLFGWFEPAQIRVVIFERMIADPAATYADLCRFLGADPAHRPENLGTRVNPYVQFRSLTARRIGKRLPALERIVGRLNTRTTSGLPPLDPEIRDRLQRFFGPRVERVRALLGDELPEWSER